jgi:hypothetical protein
VSTGSCEFRDIDYGWYRFTAGYRGTDTFASSVSAVDKVVVGAGPAFRAGTPPLTATSGRDYGYTFQATGWPTPAFALLTISNNGPRAAADLTAEVALPSQLHLRGCGWGWGRGCWVSGNTPNWHLGTVTGIAHWGNGEWWQPGSVSYAFAHVTVYPHRWW